MLSISTDMVGIEYAWESRGRQVSVQSVPKRCYQGDDRTSVPVLWRERFQSRDGRKGSKNLLTTTKIYLGV